MTLRELLKKDVELLRRDRHKITLGDRQDIASRIDQLVACVEMDCRRLQSILDKYKGR